MKILKKLLVVILLMAPIIVLAQQPADKTIMEKYIDSLKTHPYPYKFPIWGEKVYKKGFDIPLPAGVMLNYFNGKQLINITDLAVGFNGGDKVPLDFIKFGKTQASIQMISTRLDLWVLPFVDLYGIFGKSFTHTSVTVAEPIAFSTSAKFNGPTAGFGITAGGGVRGFLIIGDYNNTWTSLEGIDGSIYAQTVSARLGYVIKFPKKPYRNITLWAGPSGLFVNRTTVGSVKVSDLTGGPSQDQIDAIKNGVAGWYNNLTPPQKVVVKQIAQAFSDKFAGIDPNATIDYSLNKAPTSNWSMITGGQFQLNKIWQFRAEAGFLGGRSSLLLSVNWRFGL
ncbi:MAG TPA: hypothetical protein VGN20_05710 [Mucilaginibacter sp.]|jgi:hypothetical protein